MADAFRIGITRDVLKPNSTELFTDLGLEMLDGIPGVEYEIFPENKAVVTPDQIKDYDGVISLAPRYTRDTFGGVERLAVIGRLGVGYDNIDLEACNDANVMVFITPDSVRRPVAASILALTLALARHLLIKDRLTREGRWFDRAGYFGMELDGKTLGSIGLGNIARDMFRLFRPLDLGRCIAHDPYVSVESAAQLGVELVSLETVLRESDILTVNCALTPETRHLIGERELAMMKRSAYLVNTARGPIVDEPALIRALREGVIRGAGLDVFEQEPVSPDNPLLSMPNVVLAPHALAWSVECFRMSGQINCRGMLSVARGEVPPNVVNKKVLEQPAMKAKLARYAERARP